MRAPRPTAKHPPALKRQGSPEARKPSQAAPASTRVRCAPARGNSQSGAVSKPAARSRGRKPAQPAATRKAALKPVRLSAALEKQAAQTRAAARKVSAPRQVQSKGRLAQPSPPGKSKFPERVSKPKRNKSPERDKAPKLKKASSADTATQPSPAGDKRMVRCPRCSGAVLHLTLHTASYYDPRFHHGCGFKGTLRWERPACRARRDSRK